MSEVPLLRFQRVVKRYWLGAHSVEAVRDLTLDVNAGEFVVVLGPSGSGKSTLLHLATLLDRPSEGRIEWAGVDPWRMSERERARWRAERIGVIFQRFHVMPHWTVHENVRFRFRYIRPSEDPDRRVHEALAQVGLDSRASQRVRLLSGGELQRVVIARALAARPLLLAADEPTAQLDPDAAAEVLRHLRELHRAGVTVLLATHNAALIGEGDRILRLQHGRLVEDVRGRRAL